MNIICRDYPEKASSFFSLLNLGGIVTHLLNLQTLILSLDLTGKYKHISFYDAFYHALAISNNTSFVTSDKKYYEKVKKEGHIVLLENIHNLL